MTEDLFRCPDLLVRRVAPYGGTCCVVTFDSFTDHRTLARPGFGEVFFQTHGIDAIHVIPRQNDWYGYPEMAAAMATVHAATLGYDRVLTYGSSMGAYAAIRFAGLAGANAVLALSPQFSIHPATVPWEARWTHHGRQFDPRWERTLAFPTVADAFVVYDPTNRDVRHIALLGRKFRFQAVGLPNAGHPVTGCLAEIGLLQGLVLGMCRGDLDKSGFRAAALDQLPRSSQYLISLAKRLPARRHTQRLALMQRAVTVAPQDPAAYRCIGIELRRAGRFEDSLAMHRRAMELLPNHPNLMLEYSLSLQANGEVARAIAVLEEIHRQAGGQQIYGYQLDMMRNGPVARMLARLRRSGVLFHRRIRAEAVPPPGTWSVD